VRLLVITSVIHYEWQGQVFSYGPYAREIDIWADLFSGVGIAAPLRRDVPPGDCAPFTRQNITIEPQKEVGGNTFYSKLKLMVSLPGMAWNLSRAIRRCDAVCVRCPGNLGFLGVLLAPLFSRHLVAKYAGQWNGYPGESMSVRLQRYLLGSRYWKGPVTVYGKWPGQKAHVVPFFTSTMTREQVERASAVASTRQATSVLKILFVGRLSVAKNVDTLIDALSILKVQGRPFLCSIVGEGPERSKLEARAREYGLSDAVRFTSGVTYECVLRHMEQSDVLVLASDTEGWPKAIAEGMAHGLICIGSDRGFVPEMLGDGRGFVIPARDVHKLAEKLADIAADPEGFDAMRRRAAAWARPYSIEGLRDSLAELLATYWKWSPRPLQSKLEPESREAAL
jgi:glycosyltransferase involved in cell wall biosynthesis